MHKNLDYWYLLNEDSPKTQTYAVFFTSWMKSLIKVESWTIDQNVLSLGEEKALSLKILCSIFRGGIFHTL